MAALTPSPQSQTVEFLPDPVLPGLARPLTVAGDHTYAAIWAYVNRPRNRRGRPRAGPTSSISRELVLVRDDGQLLFDLSKSAGRRLSLGEHAASLADCFLPGRPPVPDDRLWSAAGLQRYLDGRRPDPSDVFRRLVAVLNHFVDFTGSLAEPALMAEFFAAYLLTTWFSPAFPILGLLWIIGDHGSGKSRLLALLSRLAHLGLYLPVPPPPAALRALAGLGASLAVDDASFLGQQGRPGCWSGASRRALLLAGRQRGALLPITLASPGSAPGLRHTRQLDVSGPRLFAASYQPHPAIARYFIVVRLVRTALAPLAAADPADLAAWPSGITPRDLVDDLWALSLSRLRELQPHLPLVAEAAASSGLQPLAQHPFGTASSFPLPTSHVPLLGSSLQSWHALLAVASWLSTVGVPGLFDRLLGLAQAYNADRPAQENADLSVLVLQGLFDCAAEQIAGLDPALAASDDGDARNDGDDDNDADDAEMHKLNKSVRAFERNLERSDQLLAQTLAQGDTSPVYPPPLPSVFTFSAARVLDAMRGRRVGERWDMPLETLTPTLVGRLLGQLGLKPRRTANLRTWSLTPAALARLARAYGLPVPSHLAQHFAAEEPPPSASSP